MWKCTWILTSHHRTFIDVKFCEEDVVYEESHDMNVCFSCLKFCNESNIFMLAHLWNLLKFFFKLPLRGVIYAGIISKNSLYVMSLIMLLDHLHLQNQILKKRYREIYGRPFVPFHVRVSEAIKGASYLSLPDRHGSGNRFLLRNKENLSFNQYWYSQGTIQILVQEVEDHINKRMKVGAHCQVALISTPSIYFSLPKNIQSKCKLLDIDHKWEKDPGFVYYDFNMPFNIETCLHHQFTMVIIDPPFITREVWEKYAATAELLLTERQEKELDANCILASTIAENEEMMREILDLKPVMFQPSIPNLVYQYTLYSNYFSDRLNCPNNEVIK